MPRGQGAEVNRRPGLPTSGPDTGAGAAHAVTPGSERGGAEADPTGARPAYASLAVNSNTSISRTAAGINAIVSGPGDTRLGSSHPGMRALASHS